MRFVRISLAAKYRILFGLAVLLIIGAALYLPWSWMEALALEQPFREAQRIADDYFATLHQPGGAAGRRFVYSKEFGLLPERREYQVQFIPLDRDLTDPHSILNQGPINPFSGEALRKFLRNPKSDSLYKTEREAEGRRFRYAHVVRAAKRCLGCHEHEGEKGPRAYRENDLVGMIVVNLPADLGNQGWLLSRAGIIVAGTLAGILAILVFYVITHKFILSPIHELREVALRVADGDLDVRSTVETGDEFEQLSENLNTMLERLRASQEELKKANRLLDQKLGEMAETNVALYEANRLKSEFLANVSHELRTPLTSIIGFAELLREGQPIEGSGRVSRYAENILISGRILLEIINDLLDLAKIEAGKVELRVEPVDARELCATLVDFVRPMADKKNLRLECQTEETLPILFTDRGRLRQVLFNFLSNAVIFTPEGGQVRLIARQADQWVVDRAVAADEEEGGAGPRGRGVEGAEASGDAKGGAKRAREKGIGDQESQGKTAVPSFPLATRSLGPSAPAALSAVRDKALSRDAEGRIYLAVSDTGPGIAPEHQAIIFEKFRQIDQSATREHQGTGLGLAIAKELAHLLGGEIGMQSRPGEGATFWITLPATAPQTSQERPRISLV